MGRPGKPPSSSSVHHIQHLDKFVDKNPNRLERIQFSFTIETIGPANQLFKQQFHKPFAIKNEIAQPFILYTFI